MSNQSPPVRITGLQATPLKHTSPVPLHGGTAVLDDPLSLLAANAASPNSLSPSPLIQTGGSNANPGIRPPVPPSVIAAATSAVNSNLDQEQMLRAFLLMANKVPVQFDAKSILLASRSETLEEDVKTLVNARAWSAVVELTQSVVDTPSRRVELLNKSGDALSPIMFGRFDALFRLRKFDELTDEVQIVLEEEHRQCGPIQGRLSQLRLQLKLLQMEVKSMTGRSEGALEELMAMLSAVSTLQQRGHPSSEGLLHWRRRIQCAIINLCIKQRSPKVATSKLVVLLEEVSAQAQCAAEPNAALVRAEVLILCRLSRLFLQQGELRLGIQRCDEATDKLAASGLSTDPVSMHVQLARGLALFSINDFSEAMALFEQLLETAEEGQAAVDAAGHCTGIVFEDDSLYCCAVNCYAICALQLRNITLSVRKLELLILENPVRCMSDALVFNLCTLYDLSCDVSVSAKKKQVLKQLAARYGVADVISTKSYRL